MRQSVDQLPHDLHIQLFRADQVGDLAVLAVRVRVFDGAGAEEEGAAPSIEERDVCREGEDRRVDAGDGGEADGRELAIDLSAISRFAATPLDSAPDAARGSRCGL